MSDDTKRERPEANSAITFDSMGQGYWAHKPGFRQRGGQSENSNGMGAAPRPVPCPSHPGTQCFDRGYCGDDCAQDFNRPMKNR